MISKYIFNLKTAIIYLVFILLSIAGKAQTIDITGKINDGHDKAVAFAFVIDKQTQNATFSDSTGIFKLKVAPASMLLVTCKGYKDASVGVGDKTVLNVSLTANDPSANDADKPGNDRPDNFLEPIRLVQAGVSTLRTPPSNLGETRGSPYLFKDWGHGYIVSPANTIIQDPHYLFNYDKIGGGLLATTDKKSVIEIDKGQIKTFTLFDQEAHSYVFESVPVIDSKHYVQQVVAGESYRIYKLLVTKFQTANYTNNGITSSGNNYDEYIDQSNYYVVEGSTGEPRKLSLNKRSIKSVFAGQQEKVNKFIADEGAKTIDDDYLKQLVSYLDK